jgi:hypothetical protein
MLPSSQSISASQVARITGLSQWHIAGFYFSLHFPILPAWLVPKYLILSDAIINKIVLTFQVVHCYRN